MDNEKLLLPYFFAYLIVGKFILYLYYCVHLLEYPGQRCLQSVKLLVKLDFTKLSIPQLNQPPVIPHTFLDLPSVLHPIYLNPK